MIRAGYISEEANPPRDGFPLAPISWSPRAIPLAPIVAAARGPAAQALGRRVLDGMDTDRGHFEGVVCGDILLVMGEADTLPWVDGVHYLCRDPESPNLLLPTNLIPSVAPSLLDRAVMRRLSAGPSPLAVLPFWPPRTYVLSAGAALPIEAARLERWMRGEPL